MKNRAVCIRCGAFKKDAFATCKECNLTPKTDFEAARALILSELTLYGDVSIGRPMEELELISQSIRNGKPYPIDGEEQKKVVREYSAYLKSLPQPKWPRGRKLKWLGIIVLILMLLSGTTWIANSFI